MKSETTNSTWHFYYFFKSFEALKSFMFTKKLKLWQTFSNVHNLYRVSNNDGKGQPYKIYIHWIVFPLSFWKGDLYKYEFTCLFIISCRLYHQVFKHLSSFLPPSLCILSKYIFTFLLKVVSIFWKYLDLSKKTQ